MYGQMHNRDAEIADLIEKHLKTKEKIRTKEG
jgi:hypothetical protein